MLTHAFIGLILFFILFTAATWTIHWLQRRTRGALGRVLGGGGDVRVIRRSALGWHCSCVVVDVAGTQFAVALSRRGAITLLGEVSLPDGKPVSPIPTTSGSESFADAIRHALAHYGKRR